MFFAKNEGVHLFDIIVKVSRCVLGCCKDNVNVFRILIGRLWSLRMRSGRLTDVPALPGVEEY